MQTPLKAEPNPGPSIADGRAARPQAPGSQPPAPARPPLPASVLRGTWNPASGNSSDASPALGPLAAPQRLRLRKPRCGRCGTPTSLPGLPGRRAGSGCLPPGYRLRAPPVLPACCPAAAPPSPRPAPFPVMQPLRGRAAGAAACRPALPGPEHPPPPCGSPDPRPPARTRASPALRPRAASSRLQGRNPRESLRFLRVVALQRCVSAVWHSARSYRSTHTPPLLGFPYHPGHHTARRSAPCAFQQALISCLFSVFLSVPIPQPIPLLPSHLSHSKYSLDLSLSLLCK